jgi:alcohol dehydrogenase class IV
MKTDQIFLESVDQIIELISDKHVCFITGINSYFSILHNTEAAKLTSIQHHRFVAESVVMSKSVSDLTNLVEFARPKIDMLIAIGGGSVIDTCKLVSLNTNIDMIAIPTTIGTGAESTQFAVVYDGVNKSSVESVNMLPKYVYLNGSFADSTTYAIRRSSMFDALVQLVESTWSKSFDSQLDTISVNAIMQYGFDYIYGNNMHSTDLIIAANRSGQCINKYKTNVVHALSYALAYELKISHGEALMLTFPYFNRIANRRGYDSIDPYELNAFLSDCGYSKYRLTMPFAEFNEKILKHVNIERLNNCGFISLTSPISSDLYEYLISDRI